MSTEPPFRPYYDDGTVSLYHGDCREVTAWLEGDMLVTDPPYGVTWKLTDNRHYSGPHGGAIVGNDSTEARDEVLTRWGDRPWIVFGHLRASLPAGWRQALVFHKDCHNAGLIGSHRPWRNNWEPIFVGGTWPKQVPRLDAVVRTFEKAAAGYSGYATRAGHPAAKPVDVMRQLLEVCPPGVIVDPFAGAGSTLVAAKGLGRQAIGVEIEERYCEIAAKRCAQGVLWDSA